MKRNSIIKKIYQEKTINKVSDKVELLGIRYNYDVIDLLNKRLLLCLIIFIVLLIFNKNGYILAPLVTVLCYYGSEYFFLDYRIKKRIKKLDVEALFFFEVLALTLESGRNLKGALDMTCDNIDSELSEEFKKTLAEVRLGKSMSEALNDMKSRIPSDAINNVILNITQSTIFGNNIVESIYNQVVVFFIPLMLLLILGPVLVNFLLS